MKSTCKELACFFLIAFLWMWLINLPRVLAACDPILLNPLLPTLMGYIAGAVIPYWTSYAGRWISFLILLIPAGLVVWTWLRKKGGKSSPISGTTG